MIQPLPRFHLAFPVTDLAATRSFYCGLGCTVGRSSDRWIDFNFYGHQLTAHLQSEPSGTVSTNPVDGESIPIRHFGVILEWQVWQQLADRLKSQQTAFVIQPYIRFKGEIGEQATLFIQDPSGNALEFKSFKDESRIFASGEKTVDD
jgi:uncharacterized protein